MKVIDLLNKIANGEEVPKNIKVDDKYYKWCNSMKDYEEENSYKYLVEELETEELNNEVEIIEEDKKIRKLDFIEENTFSKRQNGMTSEDRRLLDSNFKELGIKINEIIDYLEENKND